MKAFSITWRNLGTGFKPYEGKRHGRAIPTKVEDNIHKFLENPQNCVFDPNKKYVLKRLGKARSVLNKTMRRNHEEFVRQGNRIGFLPSVSEEEKTLFPENSTDGFSAFAKDAKIWSSRLQQ